MKLLAKTSLIYLLTTLLVFVIGGLVFYYNLRKIVDEETTERLYTEKSQVEDFVKAHDTIPGNSFTSEDFLAFQKSEKTIPQKITDTTFFSKEEGEDLPFRQLSFSINAKGNNYSVLISKNLFETDDLVEAILTSFSVIIAVLLVVILTVNRIAAGKLLKPFFNTVNQLHAYKLDEHKSLSFSGTTTSEFRELNSALQKMTEKISDDYRNLKAFTENASHELQTPLSVIMASTENLLQQENLDEKQLEAIRGIHQTARKLSKLNQTLLLLAKIENRQFAEKEKVNLGESITSRLELYAELITHKEITLKKNIGENVFILIHPVLAEVMISNLITNAIRHNSKGGIILIELDSEKIRVCNSGDALHSDGEKLFERFYKENTSSESTGLGLSLVKQVAETNGMRVNYSYRENLHCFEVFLPQSYRDTVQ
jgi:signal transduction histidine kinase